MSHLVFKEATHYYIVLVYCYVVVVGMYFLGVMLCCLALMLLR